MTITLYIFVELTGKVEQKQLISKLWLVEGVCWSYQTDIKCSKPWSGVCIFISYPWLLGHINIVIMNFHACYARVWMLQQILCKLQLDNQRSCLKFNFWLSFTHITQYTNKQQNVYQPNIWLDGRGLNRVVVVNVMIRNRRIWCMFLVMSGMEILRQ